MRCVVETRGVVLVRSIYFGFYILSAIFYLLSPFDIIPEAVFGLFGLLDDVIYVLLMMVFLSRTFYELLRDQNEERLRAR